MALRKIVEVGDECLLKKCRQVTEFNRHLHLLLDDMAETMRAADGVGLAAVQVGVLRRVVVIETEAGKLIELINPRIIESEGEQEEAEGCLSLPGKYGITHRPKKVVVVAENRHGEPVEYMGEDLLARAFCHEIDHLDGVLFTDRATHMYTDEEMEELYGGDDKE